MTYEFGDYTVETKHLKAVFFYPSTWKMTVFYKDEYVHSSDYHFKESYALSAAKYEILAHKNALEALSNV